MTESNTARDGVLGVIMMIGIIAALIIASNLMLTACENADEAKQNLVETCVASGGSWIVDGDSGECWHFPQPPAG